MGSREGLQNLKACSSDPLPPARFLLLKGPPPFQQVLTAGDQVSKHRDLWGTFHFQTTTMPLITNVSKCHF